MFEHDTEVALANAAALVNTAPSEDATTRRPELLPDVPALRAFLTEWRWTHLPELDDRVLDRVRALRPRLRKLWTTDLPGRVAGINDLLEEHDASPRLVEHGDYGWHVHAARDDAPLHARMAVEAAMAMVDLVRLGETERLRTCAAEDCDKVLVDLSRNRSKIYCDAGCADKVHASAYRARRAT